MKYPALIIGFSLSASAFADYQIEFAAGFAHTEIEAHEQYNSSYETYQDSYDAWNLAQTYYFRPVSTRNVPLSDAAFLAHSSFVNADYRQSDWDERKDSEAQININWVLPKGVILGASYGEQEIDDSFETETIKGPGIIVGHYLSQTSAVQLHYQKIRYRLDSEDFYSDGESVRSEVYTLSYKNLIMLDERPNTDIELAITKTLEYADFATRIGWYSGNQIKYGVIAGLSDYEFGILDQRRYGLWAEWFIQENLALSAQYLVNSGKYPGPEYYYRYQEAATSLDITFRL